METQTNQFVAEMKIGLISCLKTTIVFAIIFSAIEGVNISLQKILMTFCISFMYSFGIGFGIGIINQLLDKKWDWLAHTNTRVYTGIIATLIYTIPVVLGINYVIFIYFQEQPLGIFFSQRMIWIHLFYLILSLGVSTFFHARSFMLNWKNAAKKEVTQQKIVANRANAQFESLKNQIDPHFLFNSLNVLSSLIEENPESAQKFTTSLSKIYRYVLEQKDKELVSVEEELDFAKLYMNLLKMRFENSLFYELPDSIANSDAKVVPLSLQLLLENSVKHNIVSEQKPLHIKIYMTDNYLAIQNNFQKKEVLQSGQGVGLQNIVERYNLITDRKVIVEQSPEKFMVKIPVLTKQIKQMGTNTIFNENSAYLRAQKRVEALKSFYGNLISYCCVIPFLVFVNLKNNHGFYWFWFPALGWGFGLLMHAFQTFGFANNWEERKINEILAKEKNKKNW